MNVRNWALAFLTVAIVTLSALSIWHLIQVRQAIGAWQAEVERLNDEVERLELQVESDFYRGVIASCTGIGLQMGVPGEVVSLKCAAYMRMAYEADWLNELRPDNWTWPPDDPARQRYEIAPLPGNQTAYRD